VFAQTRHSQPSLYGFRVGLRRPGMTKFLGSRNGLPAKHPHLLPLLQPLDNLAAGRGDFGFVSDEAGLHRRAVADAFAEGFCVIAAGADEGGEADGLGGDGGEGEEEGQGEFLHCLEVGPTTDKTRTGPASLLRSFAGLGA
jgi:hypothetical protein